MIDENGEKTRSGLWFDYAKAIRILRPRFAVMENVGALVNRGLTTVLGSLTEIGYDAEWQDIRAEDMGAPHRRERIWIVAYPEHFRLDETKNAREDKKVQSESKARPELSNNEFKGISSIRKKNIDRKNVVYTKSRESREQTEWKRRENISGRGKKGEMANATTSGFPLSGHESGIKKIQQENRAKFSSSKIPNNDCKGLQGRKESGNIKSKRSEAEQLSKRYSKPLGKNYWTVEPAVGRLVNGLPGRVDRLKGLGNAIVPQIAELLFNQIKNYL